MHGRDCGLANRKLYTASRFEAHRQLPMLRRLSASSSQMNHPRRPPAPTTITDVPASSESGRIARLGLQQGRADCRVGCDVQVHRVAHSGSSTPSDPLRGSSAVVEQMNHRGVLRHSDSSPTCAGENPFQGPPACLALHGKARLRRGVQPRLADPTASTTARSAARRALADARWLSRSPPETSFRTGNCELDGNGVLNEGNVNITNGTITNNSAGTTAVACSIQHHDDHRCHHHCRQLAGSNGDRGHHDDHRRHRHCGQLGW